MSEKDVVFIKEKDLDFPRLLKETRLLECEVDRVCVDGGLCSNCQNPAGFRDEFCPYCGAEFGQYFDLNLVEGAV